MIKDVSKCLRGLYTPPFQLRPLANQLDQVLKLLNQRRKLLIDYNGSHCRFNFLGIRVFIFLKQISPSA